jgi:protein TonB
VVEARVLNKKPRAENAKFQGRTLEETASNRKPSGSAAPQPAATAEPAAVASGEAAVAEPLTQTAAKLVKRVAPEYPAAAASRGTEGYAVVEFTVTAEGKVVDPVIVESSPRRAFDSAARDAVRRWKYEPARNGDTAVASTARVRLEFQLAD